MAGYDGNSLALAFIITVAAGLSTSLGAAIVFFTTTLNYRFLAVGMAFSAGVMIYVSLVEILVKSYSAYTIHFQDEKKAYAAATGTLFAGVILTYLIDVLVHRLYRWIGVEGVADHTLPLEESLPSDNVLNCAGNQDGLQTEVQQTNASVGTVCVCLQGLEKPIEKASDEKSPERLMGIALITGLAIALHNFPVLL
jgi:zinc transporter ZupT